MEKPLSTAGLGIPQAVAGPIGTLEQPLPVGGVGEEWQGREGGEFPAQWQVGGAVLQSGYSAP